MIVDEEDKRREREEGEVGPGECPCCRQQRERDDVRTEMELLRHKPFSDAKLNSVSVGPELSARAKTPGSEVGGGVGLPLSVDLESDINTPDVDAVTVEYCPNIDECSQARLELERHLRNVSAEGYDNMEPYCEQDLYSAPSMAEARARLEGTADRVSEVPDGQPSYELGRIEDVLGRATEDLNERAEMLQDRDRLRGFRNVPLVNSEHPEIDVTKQFNQQARKYRIAIEQREELKETEEETEDESEEETEREREEQKERQNHRRRR